MGTRYYGCCHFFFIAVEKSDPKVEGTLTLRYTFNNEVHTQTSTIQSLPVTHENLGLHRLAAKGQLIELVDKHSSLSEEKKKEAEDVRRQIVDISVNTNVITPFTAFVGVDPDKIGKLLSSFITRGIFKPINSYNSILQ
ncbi:hypothetical protein Aperf_G00000031187 [Anoplocephala perfoliata]